MKYLLLLGILLTSGCSKQVVSIETYSLFRCNIDDCTKLVRGLTRAECIVTVQAITHTAELDKRKSNYALLCYIEKDL